MQPQRVPQMSLREVRLRQRCEVLDQQFRDVCIELEDFGNRAITTRVSFLDTFYFTFVNQQKIIPFVRLQKERIRLTFLQNQADRIEKEKEQAVKKLAIFEKKRSQ